MDEKPLAGEVVTFTPASSAITLTVPHNALRSGEKLVVTLKPGAVLKMADSGFSVTKQSDGTWEVARDTVDPDEELT